MPPGIFPFVASIFSDVLRHHSFTRSSESQTVNSTPPPSPFPTSPPTTSPVPNIPPPTTVPPISPRPPLPAQLTSGTPPQGVAVTLLQSDQNGGRTGILMSTGHLVVGSTPISEAQPVVTDLSLEVSIVPMTPLISTSSSQAPLAITSPSATTLPEAPEASHHGPNARVIVPVVLVIVVLMVVAGVFIWLKFIKKRRVKSQGSFRELIPSTGHYPQMVHVGESHPGENFTIEGGYPTEVLPSSRTKQLENQITMATEKLRAVEEAIKQQKETDIQSASDSKTTSDILGIDESAGYGWGLGRGHGKVRYLKGGDQKG